MASNVPTVQWNGTIGFVPPQQSAVLVGVSEDINAAFGGDLTQQPETPQGQLASSMAAIIGNLVYHKIKINDQKLKAIVVHQL